VRPVAQTIHVSHDGHVLAQIADEHDRPGRELDVFDPSGRYLGSMPLGFRMSTWGIPAIAGDTIVAVAIGELDVPYVLRLTIQRPRRISR